MVSFRETARRSEGASATAHAVLPDAGRFFVCWAPLALITKRGEHQVTTGHWGTRPTLAIWAACITTFALVGCAREEEPASRPAAPPPAATPAPAPAPAAAAAETIRDSSDPLQHGRYLV